METDEKKKKKKKKQKKPSNVFDRTNTDPRTGLPLGTRKSKRMSFKDFKAAERKVGPSVRPVGAPSVRPVRNRAEMVVSSIRKPGGNNLTIKKKKKR